jgi:hypothetical protein
VIALAAAGALVLVLGAAVAFLLLRGPSTAPVVAAQPPSAPSPTTETPSSPEPEQPSPTQPAPEQPAPEQPAPQKPAPQKPAPEKPAPSTPDPPTKKPLTEGIVSFSAKAAGGGTIAAACAAVAYQAAQQSDYALVEFTWISVGMLDSAELQINGTYSGNPDLQSLSANDTIYYYLDCFNADGTVKTTSYQLLMSTGTKRYGVEIVLSGSGQIGTMKSLY